jgi:predicted Zn-dependent protease
VATNYFRRLLSERKDRSTILSLPKRRKGADMPKPIIVLSATLTVALSIGLYFGPLASSPSDSRSGLSWDDESLSLEDSAAAGTAHAARAVAHATAFLTRNVAPPNAPALLEQAAWFMKAGQHDRALVDLDHLLAKQPDNVSAMHQRGIALVQVGRFQEGISDLNRVVAMTPDSAEVHFWLGKAYEMKGSLNWALASFNSVLRLVPDHPEARTHRERLLGKLAANDQREARLHGEI